MGFTVLALTAGFALAGLNLGQTSSEQQGSMTTTVGPVTGLTWNSTMLIELGAAVGPSTCTTQLTACNVTLAGATDCAGGLGGATCSTGDWVEQVTLVTTAATPFAGIVLINLVVVSGGVYHSGSVSYYTDASGNTQQLITQDFDIGTSTPAPVTTVSVVVSVLPP